MARRPAHAPLNVFLNGKRVGALRRSRGGEIDFRYHENWLAWDNNFPVSLSLPLREDRYVGEAVIAVFDNLLPDNDEIRRRVAERSDAAGIDPFSLLTSIGRDCVGALQFLPDGDEPDPAGAIDATPVDDQEIGEIVSNLAAAPLGIGGDREFRISIAGAQDKTALLRIDDQWHIPHGTTATTHIIKPQIGQRQQYDFTQSVENEHLCLEILRALDVPVAASEIVDFGETRALVVERFDRQWTRTGRLLRRPQEDCCQALGVSSARKYQAHGGPGMAEIFEFLKASDDPVGDQLLFLKAQIAFWLLGATDGHAKNFSVFLYPGGGFELTPLYDVMSVQHLLDNRSLRRGEMKLSMSVGDNNHYRVHEIQPRHYRQTERHAALARGLADEALEQVSVALPDAINEASEKMPDGFPVALRESIAAGALGRNARIARAFA